MQLPNIGVAYILYVLFFNVGTSDTQYIPAVKNSGKVSTCDGPSKTALVEHFFNVIFTEFHSNPPVCVCVQMCDDQPTYCYPNGCLKKVETKKRIPDENRPPPVPNVQNVDAVNKMFLVDDKNDYTHFLNDHSDGGKLVAANAPALKDMRPDPFKDRFKIIFKYKKMPKVELRYNLREQVKNMKSDILRVETNDVSKTRWPNINHMVRNEQQVFKTSEKHNDQKRVDIGNTNNKFLMSNSESITSKYFKRDLRRNLREAVNDEPEYITEMPDPLDNKNFSLETLLENLIGNNYEGKREIETKSTVTSDDSKYNITREIVPSLGNELDSNTSKINEQTCVISINMTNQNLAQNRYIEDRALVEHRINKWQNYTFNQMIAALAKRIEKQNNTSMEILNQVSKNDVQVISDNRTEPLQVDNNIETTEETPKSESSTDEIQTVVVANASDTTTLNVTQENYINLMTD